MALCAGCAWRRPSKSEPTPQIFRLSAESSSLTPRTLPSLLPRSSDEHGPVCRLRLAETIKFGANPPDPWPTVRQAAEEAEGDNPSQPPFSGELQCECVVEASAEVKHGSLVSDMV